MNLLQLAKAVKETERKNHSILIYGPPKTGKTRLVGTAAKIPELKRIFWFDLENGAETLLHMGLTDQELEKITLFQLPDTRENPVGIETMLKAFSSKIPTPICHAHGVVSCVKCKTPEESTKFCLAECTHEDLIVIDSGSQLGDSALNLACKGKDITVKPGWDEYGLQGKFLGDIISTCQQVQYTNILVITHEVMLEDEVNGVKKDRIYPLMGSKNFCIKVSKYFGTVIYTEIKLRKHTAGSSSVYKDLTQTGSRLNVCIEKSAEPSMKDILIEGGVLKANS